jgi:hypothetical protein
MMFSNECFYYGYNVKRQVIQSPYGKQKHRITPAKTLVVRKGKYK